jgi:hypothetical protein
VLITASTTSQMNVILCGYGSYVLFGILADEYRNLLNEPFLNERTRTVVQGEPMVVVRYLVHEEAAVSVLFMLCVGMGFALVCFDAFHLYLVSCNLTTNEFFKRRQLRRSRKSAPNRVSGNAMDTSALPAKKPHLRIHLYDLGSLAANWREVWSPRYRTKVTAAKRAAASKRSAHQKGVKSA